MKTVKISKDLAAVATDLFNAGKTPWIFVVNGEVLGVYQGRAKARQSAADFVGEDIEHRAIVKAADVKFEIEQVEQLASQEEYDAAHGRDFTGQSVDDADDLARKDSEALPTVEEYAGAFDAKLAELQKQGDNAANAAEVVEGTAKAGKIPMTRESTIERPCKRVWHIADEMAQAAGGHKNIKRKDVLARCVASGIAFYTARTQYQMWLTIQNGGTL